MKVISHIGANLKKIYRTYSSQVLLLLETKGFSNLRPSFLEVLQHICDNEGASIRDIGLAINLKKQTMTSHLNELERRGYIIRRQNPNDRREQNVFLTEFGSKFKFALAQSLDSVETNFVNIVGQVELERIEEQLSKFYEKVRFHNDQGQSEQQSLEL